MPASGSSQAGKVCKLNSLRPACGSTAIRPKKVPLFKVGKQLKEIVDESKQQYVIREA
jgi:hypothetical protein